MLQGKRIGANLHVTKETAVLVRALLAGGAEVAITGCNAFSTQDDVSAALAAEGVHVYATHGCSNEEYYKYIDAVVAIKPHLVIDDGCDLCVAIHQASPEIRAGVIGGCEQTTSGVIRLRNMDAKVPQPPKREMLSSKFLKGWMYALAFTKAPSYAANHTDACSHFLCRS